MRGASNTIFRCIPEVAQNLHLTDKEIAEAHDERRTNLQYRLAWVRTYLKAYGLLDNSERGVWVLTAKGKDIDTVNPRQVTRFVHDLKKGQRSELTQKNTRDAIDVEVIEVAEDVFLKLAFPRTFLTVPVSTTSIAHAT